MEAVHGQNREKVGRQVEDVVILCDDHEGYEESYRLHTEPGTVQQDEKDVVHTLDHRSYTSSPPTTTTTTTTVGRTQIIQALIGIISLPGDFIPADI